MLPVALMLSVIAMLCGLDAVLYVLYVMIENVSCQRRRDGVFIQRFHLTFLQRLSPVKPSSCWTIAAKTERSGRGALDGPRHYQG
jgi:hypothetical protein